MTNTDPENIDMERVSPSPNLAHNFDQKLCATLSLSTKAKVWSHQKKDNDDCFEPAIEAKLRHKILSQGNYECRFCGFHSLSNEIHNISDNHADISEQNLGIADYLCHAWHHLGQLKQGEAYIVYLPGLSPQDVNHLQRAIAVALQSDDENLRKDADDLLDWLASHRDYVDSTWGTYEPNVFADALLKIETNNHEFVFKDLALVLNPAVYREHTPSWKQAMETTQWDTLLHHVNTIPE